MKRPHDRRSLRLENLEARECPAATITVLGSVMTIRGDNLANNIAISDNGQNAVTATVDALAPVTATGITTIRVNAEAGNDVFAYRLTGAAGTPRSLFVDLGKGNDSGSLNLGAGFAAGRFFADVQGNDGIDSLAATLGSVAQGASAVAEVNGGKGTDVINGAFTGALNGFLDFKLDGQDDADTVVGNLTINAGSTGALDTSVRGGKGNDQLTLNVIDNTAINGRSRLAFFEADIRGDDGVDTLTNTANVRARQD